MPRNEVASPSLLKDSTVDINVLHDTFGHVTEDTVRKTAGFYGIKVKGTMKPCEHCKIGNARQKDVPKETQTHSETLGERLFIDQSSVKAKSYGGSKYWLLVLDDASDITWSSFLKKKSDQVEKLVSFLKDLKAKHNVTVKYIRCDNAGENKKLQERCESEGLGITFEYTPSNSPQFNGKVERAFAALYSQVRALNNAAQFTKELRDGLWCEAANHATDIRNMLVSARKASPSYQQFYKREYPGMRTMRKFGEIAIIKNKSGVKGKLEDRGRAAVYLGRAKDSFVPVPLLLLKRLDSLLSHFC